MCFCEFLVSYKFLLEFLVIVGLHVHIGRHMGGELADMCIYAYPNGVGACISFR